MHISWSICVAVASAAVVSSTTAGASSCLRATLSYSLLAASQLDARTDSTGTPAYRRRVAEALAVTPQDHSSTASAYLDLAIACLQEGSWREAGYCAQEAIEHAAKGNVTDLGLLELAHGTLGRALREMDLPARAEPHYRRALELCQQRLGPQDKMVAIRTDNLGVLLNSMGRFEESAAQHRAARAMFKEIAGADSQAFAQAQQSLSMALLNCQEPDLPEIRRMLADSVRIMAAQRPMAVEAWAVAVDNLGTVTFTMKEVASSVTLHRRALTALSDRLGPDHPAVLLCTSNLVSSLVSLEPPAREEATALLTRVLPIAQRRLGADHPTTQTILALFPEAGTEPPDGDAAGIWALVSAVRSLPETRPVPYGSVTEIVRDIRSVGSNPDSVIRLLQSCTGFDGRAYRALAKYRTAMLPHVRAMNTRFGVPDPLGGHPLGIPNDLGEVLVSGDEEDPQSGFSGIRVTDLSGAVRGQWLVVSAPGTTTGEYLIWADTVSASSVESFAAVVLFMTSLDPRRLLDADALRSLAEQEAERIAAGAYESRDQARDALILRLRADHWRRPSDLVVE